MRSKTQPTADDGITGKRTLSKQFFLLSAPAIHTVAYARPRNVIVCGSTSSEIESRATSAASASACAASRSLVHCRRSKCFLFAALPPFNAFGVLIDAIRWIGAMLTGSRDDIERRPCCSVAARVSESALERTANATACITAGENEALMRFA